MLKIILMTIFFIISQSLNTGIYGIGAIFQTIGNSCCIPSSMQITSFSQISIDVVYVFSNKIDPICLANSINSTFSETFDFFETRNNISAYESKMTGYGFSVLNDKVVGGWISENLTNACAFKLIFQNSCDNMTIQDPVFNHSINFNEQLLIGLASFLSIFIYL